MKSLYSHFQDSLTSNEELIGLEVVTKDGEKYFISDFDRFCDSKHLPKTLFVSGKRGSNYGNAIDSSNLFIPNKI